MKTVVEVNLGNFGSTGTIMKGIAKAGHSEYLIYQAFPGGEKNTACEGRSIVLSSSNYKKISRQLAYYTGYNGCFAVISTLRFLSWLDTLKPDLLHFHNLHDSYINLPLLFAYVKKHKIPVVWTLHDCWAFTGRCPHFIMAQCDRWKTGCFSCPQLNTYPMTLRDKSRFLWEHKRRWFTGIPNLTIVTPSQWLAGLVKQSFLKDYPVKVIHNGIDLTVFKPTPSDFRKKYHCEDKYVVLGVAFGWGIRKGLDVFIELSGKLDDRYQIVLVGTDIAVDRELPDSIISIHRTQNQIELAEIYTAADVFVNPTREEVLGLVNIEALACGTPVITFNSGGSPECIDDTCGCVVNCDNTDQLAKEINRMYLNKPYPQKACQTRAKSFDMRICYNHYYSIYESIVGDKSHGE